MKGASGSGPASAEDLIDRLRQGDERAFDAFLEEYAPRLYRFAVSRLGGDEEAAREAVQSTLVDVVRSLHTYRGEANFFTWLCSCCQRHIGGLQRRGARTRGWTSLDAGILSVEEALEKLSLEGDGPAEAAEQKEIRELVHMTLDHLSRRHKSVLRWKYLEGISVREIASRMDVSPKAAESVLTRARNAFRQSFEEVAGRLRREAPAAGDQR
jgi:RNA polymerase sigma-70 factor (ECF subfamily)